MQRGRRISSTREVTDSCADLLESIRGMHAGAAQLSASVARTRTPVRKICYAFPRLIFLPPTRPIRAVPRHQLGFLPRARKGWGGGEVSTHTNRVVSANSRSHHRVPFTNARK